MPHPRRALWGGGGPDLVFLAQGQYGYVLAQDTRPAASL